MADLLLSKTSLLTFKCDGTTIIPTRGKHNSATVKAVVDMLKYAEPQILFAGDEVSQPPLEARGESKGDRDVDRLVGGLVVDEDDLVHPILRDRAERLLQRAGRVLVYLYIVWHVAQLIVIIRPGAAPGRLPAAALRMRAAG